jgi:hypothetical protein
MGGDRGAQDVKKSTPFPKLLQHTVKRCSPSTTGACANAFHGNNDVMLWWLASGMCQCSGIGSLQVWKELQHFVTVKRIGCVSTLSRAVNF